MSQDSSRYSEACTRAAIAAIASAAVALGLIQKLLTVDSLEAYGSYVLARERLENALVDISNSVFGPAILRKVAPQAPDDSNIRVGELAELVCTSDTMYGLVAHLPTESHEPKPTSSPVADSTVTHGTPAFPRPSDGPLAVDEFRSAVPLPSAPTGLRAYQTTPCPGVDELVLSLGELWDDERLGVARKLGNEIDMTIYRWQVARYRTVARLANNADWQSQVSKKYFEGEHLNLPLRDVRELASTSRPTIEQFAGFTNRHMSVATPYGSSDQTANSAALVVQAATFLFVCYFFFMARAGKVAGAMGDPASLFSVYLSTLSGRIVFVCLALVPVASTVFLANTMRGVQQRWAVFLMFGVLIAVFKSLELFFSTKTVPRVRFP